MNARLMRRVRRTLGATIVVAIATACAPDAVLVRLPQAVPPTSAVTDPAAGSTGAVVAAAPTESGPASTSVPAVAVSAGVSASIIPLPVSTTPEAPSPPGTPTVSTSVPVVATAGSDPATSPATTSPATTVATTNPARAFTTSSQLPPSVAADVGGDPAGPACQPFPGAWAMGSDMPAYASRMFVLQNDLRRQNGRAPLVWDGRTAAAADAAAVRLAASHELAHFTTTDTCRVLSLDQYARSDATWWKLAENVGEADPTPAGVDKMFEAYVRSPEHLQNILDPAFDRVGIATYVSVEDGSYLQWNAVVFAGSASAIDVVPPPS